MIYLDNSSTTKPCASAISAINDALENNWGNPSSLHKLGINAECIINETRENIANILKCKCNEIYFTSGGTEANNLAILSGANSMKRRGNKIITTSIEHPSVLNTFTSLEQNGFEVTYIKPRSDGNILAEDVINAADDKTILVSCMLVNNETGCILPVSKISEGLKSKKCNALIHTDCVQAFGKIDIDVDSLGVDLLSASGHKIHGPKGIGFLYKSSKVNLKPILFGGNQERGLRSGTEAVPLIAGLNGALKELNISDNIKTVTNLYVYTIDSLKKIDGIVINSPPKDTIPYIVNFSFTGYRSETLLHHLESKNIFVSSGSACSKGKGSHVLNEMGLSPSLVDSAIRISFSRYNTLSEIDTLCNALAEVKTSLYRKQGNKQ